MNFKINAKGFTLIELMIVVAIIGIMAAIAIPNFLTYMCKSKQAEARANLGNLTTMQESFFSVNNIYSTNFNDLGFTLKGTPRYTYVVTVADTSNFTSVASSTSVSGTKTDYWYTNTSHSLVNSTNACQ